MKGWVRYDVYMSIIAHIEQPHNNTILMVEVFRSKEWMRMGESACVREEGGILTRIPERTGSTQIKPS